MIKGSLKDIIKPLKNFSNLVISGVIVIVIFILTTNFLIPNIDNIKTVLEDQKTADKKISVLQQKFNILSDLNKDEELNNLKKITTILPEEKDVFSIFGGLDDLQTNSNVVITNSNFRIGVVSTGSAAIKINPPPKTKYLPIDINLEILGNSDQIISFLRNLTSFKTRLFTAKNVDISSAGKDHYSAAFVLSTYYQPFPAQLGEIDTPLPVLNPEETKIKSLILQNAQLPSEEGVSLPSGKTNLFTQ